MSTFLCKYYSKHVLAGILVLEINHASPYLSIFVIQYHGTENQTKTKQFFSFGNFGVNSSRDISLNIIYKKFLYII